MEGLSKKKSNLISICVQCLSERQGAEENTLAKLMGAALHESAKGTKHLYEVLDILHTVWPEDYEKEFIAIKKKYEF